MELIIAEKPSVAKEYIKMVEKAQSVKFTQKDGYYQSNDNKYAISWAVGHLVSLAMPDAYGWTRESQSLEKLPMIPDKWEYVINQTTKKQFNTLKELCDKASIITNGCDAGREGELIFRLITMKNGNFKKPSNRIWLNQLTLHKMVEAWNQRKPSSEYNNLFASAMCRQKADWLVGMNYSTAYSLATNYFGLSIGRVQTPTLKLIVDRHLSIINWQVKYYYQLIGSIRNINFTYYKDSQKDFEDSSTLEEVKKDLKPVSTIEQKEIKSGLNNPPNPFDLSNLQKQANQSLGLSANETLKCTQSLYEKKLVSYPRTDSSYLPVAMLPEAYEILEYHITSEQKENLKDKDASFSFFNDDKITDHYAIIPTLLSSTDNLTPKEKGVYSLILNRFIQAFGKPYEFEATNIILNNNNHIFKSTFKNTTSKGYKTLFGSKEDSEDITFNYNKGDSVCFTETLIDKKELTKPTYYTESSLLTAMENCSKEIEDIELKKQLKEANGIGTAATRASMIEKLKDKKYISLQKKYLIPTKKGIELIAVVDESVASPLLTAEWESKLSLVSSGEYKWSLFLKEIEEYTSRVTENLDMERLSQFRENTQKELLICPKCNRKSLVQTPKVFFCKFNKEDESCDFTLFPIIAKKQLTGKNVSDLLLKKTTSLIKGFKKKDSEDTFDAKLKLDDKFNVAFSFDSKPKSKRKLSKKRR